MKTIRVLIVSRYKTNFVDNILPFVKEQGEAIRALGHEVEYFLVKGNYVTAVRELKKKIREFKPDIVHAHYGLSAITAELQSEVPVVTTFHNGETHHWWVNLLTSLMSLRAKHVIYVAPHIRDLVYFKAKNYSIIPCGVSLEDCFLMDKAEARRKLGWSDDTKYIMFGGAFDNLRKNYALLKQAVEIIENKNKENTANAEENIKENDSKSKTRSQQSIETDSYSIDPQSAQKQAFGQPTAQSCVIVDSEDQLSATYKNADIQSSQKNAKNDHADSSIEIIEMKGLSRAECVLRMNACDLFALPTKNEGSPQALKEAMACNCPIVATDVADIKYLLGDMPGHYVLANKKGNGAWWKGDEHSAEELATLLKQALAFERRTEGRKRIVELGYTNELVAKKIIAIYQQVLEENKQR